MLLWKNDGFVFVLLIFNPKIIEILFPQPAPVKGRWNSTFGGFVGDSWGMWSAMGWFKQQTKR